ncbi:MAG: hypothetical protein WBN60_15620 [Polyangiales bacterium]
MLRIFGLLLLASCIACGSEATSSNDGGAPGSGGSGGSGGTVGTGGSVGAGGSGGMADSFTVKWGPFEVPAGFEQTRCVMKRLGNAEPISVHEIHNVLGATSHHFIVYQVDDTVERPEPYPCNPFTDTFNDPPLIITQRSDDRLTLPEGVAYTIEPNQMVRLELHYINPSVAPQIAEATSTFVSMPSEDVENEADIMFLGIRTSASLRWTRRPSGPRFFSFRPDLTA